MTAENKMTAHEPLFRVVKRAERSSKQMLLFRLGAVLLSILAGGLFILAIGQDPIKVYGLILSGATRSKLAFQGTIKLTIPLCISALGVTLAFKMKFWNIGGEGQIIMGGIFATYFALWHANWPHIPLMLVCFLAGLIGGGLWGLMPALCKVKWGTNETLLTLMLNYIALYLVVYLQNGPWQDPSANGFPKIATFAPNAHLGKVLGVQAGWIVMLVLVAVLWVYLRQSKQGYEISVVGESQDTARYAGIQVKKVILRTMFLSGAIAGLCGMLQAVGTDNTLSVGIAGGVGFTAITVAWLCNLNPGMILVVSFLFSVLEKGSGVVQSKLGISSDSAAVLQGVILFFILASEFFVRYSFVFRKKQKQAPKAPAAQAPAPAQKEA